MTSAVKTPKPTRPHPTINSEPVRDAARQTARDELDRLVDILARIAERVECRTTEERRAA